MQSAQTEMSHYREFDYLVVNDDFNTALADLKAIVRSEHLRRERRVADITHLITNLLATKGQKTDNSE
jgi:guanylate kinase